MPTAAERRKAREAKERAWARRILATYGITPEQYWECWRYQAGKCAICCRATGRTRRLAVDHDHSCGEGHDPKTGCPKCVRGLCCQRCNRFIGLMGDDPRAFDRAARYLRTPPFQELRMRAKAA